MFDALATFDTLPAAPQADFTYAHPGQSRFRRNLIRAVEVLTGQPKLRRLYLNWAWSDRLPGVPVFAAALRQLDIRPRLSAGAEHLSQVPAAGGLLLVANHPFGVVDGLTLGHLGMQLRGNVRILTNSLLCRVPEIDPYLLPVDFSGTPEARRLTAETRRKAASLLAAGNVVAIFPAGGVATANKPLAGRAVDSPWHPFVGRLATNSRRDDAAGAFLRPELAPLPDRQPYFLSAARGVDLPRNPTSDRPPDRAAGRSAGPGG